MPRHEPPREHQGVLHLHQYGTGHQNPAIDFMENVGMPEKDEVIERAGIGDDDHAGDYRLFAASTRSSVAMSLSRSSTV